MGNIFESRRKAVVCSTESGSDGVSAIDALGCANDSPLARLRIPIWISILISPFAKVWSSIKLAMQLAQLPLQTSLALFQLLQCSRATTNRKNSSSSMSTTLMFLFWNHTRFSRCEPGFETLDSAS